MVIVSKARESDVVDAFLLSTGLTALAEVGDRTQLLAFLLAARYRQPAQIMLGILLATVLNHLLAGLVGTWLAAVLQPHTIRWLLGLSFLLMAGWILIPDDIGETRLPVSQLGVVAATSVTFFLAEMGDKTQIATVALTARFDALAWVVAGTTLGMMIANVPAVYAGDRLADRLPVRAIQCVAAALFALLGLATLLSAVQSTGI